MLAWSIIVGWTSTRGRQKLSNFAADRKRERTGMNFENRHRADGDRLWSRKERGRFPELKELKQLVRDRVAPGRDLGHVDR